ncbi:MAG: 50S ribosomal protein L24 [Deltaproteobacteria bacterium]|nr:50S ribosomal protein L24 [Deltaproteobacteria bacterium]
MRAQIRKNDTIMIIAGKDRGKSGKVLRVLPERNRVLIERLNMVKRHSRARGPQSPHGIVDKEAPLQLSNVMIMCDKCSAPVRMGKKQLHDGRSVRVCRRCGEQLDR